MCTLIAACGRAEPPFLASTSDNPYATRNRVELRHPAGGLRYAAIVIHSTAERVPWDGMVTRAVNEAGLAFTYSYVEPHDAAPANHDGVVHFSQRLASECTCADEAITMVSAGVPAGATGNYLVLDRRGALVVIEAFGDGAATSRAERLVRTNQWLSSDAPAQRTSPYTQTASRRADRATELLQSALTPGDAWSILADHDGRKPNEQPYGSSICNHGIEHGTVSAEVLLPSERTLHYSYGHPCREPQARLTSWSRPITVHAHLEPAGHITDLDGHLLRSPAIQDRVASSPH